MIQRFIIQIPSAQVHSFHYRNRDQLGRFLPAPQGRAAGGSAGAKRRRACATSKFRLSCKAYLSPATLDEVSDSLLLLELWPLVSSRAARFATPRIGAWTDWFHASLDPPFFLIALQVAACHRGREIRLAHISTTDRTAAWLPDMRRWASALLLLALSVWTTKALEVSVVGCHCAFSCLVGPVSLIRALP